ncbi:hypothetical protein SAMN02787144_102044 [Streptomyces atratus]|uniref:Histidine kinase n=1 Tax=Streptomyces atratus TaxID=1893 RepID=A0A1K2EM68_STRAR|nr:hypothetical protein SAMN02787144_102044 [Streptomyces atratus]
MYPCRSTVPLTARSERYEVKHRTPSAAPDRTGDPDARWLTLLMHAAFFLLLGASLTRFLLRHPGEARTPWIIALSVALAVLYVLGPVLGSRPTPRSLVWLGVLVAVWMVLIVLAPSFAWCAVPLFFTGLRILPPRAAPALVALLTLFVVAAQLRLAGGFDPNLVLAPTGATRATGSVRGHGLPAIRARLQQLGGTLTIESVPGEGTVLSAVVPLTPAAPPTAPEDLV